ncbi:gamma-glutamylcyclotransferase [Halomonas qaidamensis]|uniref:Gamma-glutamylcyclotransferase n=1 Tax=Halomonas qaidamensis TaxID=2866211 RepID=A0ABY6JQJ7_9GAMM|nr:gamma-glutamylcyclotransferase family protein [Halomonas qaidamensis]UYV19430.1 gamma-glutamylcyclotransferase [Halomonas qaidamensis]
MDNLKRDIARCPRVAVYGTLKRGQRNHHWLGGTALLGHDYLTALTLYDLGPYPGAKQKASQGALVEVYAINSDQLALLDQLEEYCHHAPLTGTYCREIFQTRHGSAWCYLYNYGVKDKMRIDNGEW